jgi:hypothetical protein
VRPAEPGMLLLHGDSTEFWGGVVLLVGFLKQGLAMQPILA